ncbi:hypothetical protein [Trichococcus shcherbakoviae]|uniref:hypothetical protein n=1 Tax=Trichococcus shcherbakoviae TaxID=2094020 RepID=UPI002AA83CBE|nr:hypothetical protein [Trichococcus shcherbakoviae]
MRGVHYNLVQNDGNPCYFEYREGSPPDVPYKYLTATFETLSNPVRCVINFDGAMVRNQEDDWYGTSRYTLVDGDTCCNLKGIVPTPDLGNPPTLIASMNC